MKDPLLVRLEQLESEIKEASRKRMPDSKKLELLKIKRKAEWLKIEIRSLK